MELSPKTTAAKAEAMARLTRQQEADEARRRAASSSQAAAAGASTGLLRSERMCMLQLIVQHDAAQATVEELGALGSLMFVDLNEGVSAFRRNFLPEIRRCATRQSTRQRPPATATLHPHTCKHTRHAPALPQV